MDQLRRKWAVLFTMCLLTAMLNFDVAAINVAVPEIAHEFNASLANMQWVIGAYVLLSAMFQILGGRLGDNYGAKKIFVIGTLLFTAASALAGFAASEWALIFARVLQGLALGIAYPMTIVLTLSAFPKGQQGFALSFIVATMGLWLAIGPPLGGVIVHAIGWRWIFFINVPFGLLAVVLALIHCRSDKVESPKKIDGRGSLLLILGMLGIVLGINQSQNWGVASLPFALTFGGGLVALVALYFQEKTVQNPILDFDIFRKKNVQLYNLIRLPMQFVFISILFFLPLYLQNVMGYSAIYSGMVLLSLTLVIGILAPIAGKWVDKVGDKIPTVLSMILLVIACLVLAKIEKGSGLWGVGSALFLIGIATSVMFVSTVTGSVAAVQEKEAGAATGIIFTTAWLGCALAVAIMGAIMSPVSKTYLKQELAASGYVLDPADMNKVERVATGISPMSTLNRFIPEVKEIASDSFLHGFRRSMYVWMMFCMAGLAFALRLEKTKSGHKKGTLAEPYIP